VQVIRIYSDAEGTARFEDVDLALGPVTFAPPAPDLETSAPMAAHEALVLRFAPGWTGPAHPAPARQLMAFVRGALEVEAGGEVRPVGAGDIVLLEDTVGTGHRTTALEETVALVVRL